MRLYGQKTRETPVAQELYTVGYYIFTVDGPNMTVDFYSDTHATGIRRQLPMGAETPPILSTSRRSSPSPRSRPGLQLDRNEFLVARAFLPQHALHFSGTTAQFSPERNQHGDGLHQPPLVHAVDLGWDAPTCATSSAICLVGHRDIGSSSGDTSPCRCPLTQQRQ